VALTALAASLSPLRELSDYTNTEQFMQKYYKELTPDDMGKVIERIEGEVEKQYGVRPHVRRPQADGRRRVRLLSQPRRVASAAANACTPASRRTTSRAARRFNTSAC
jgi:hypothetical protein